MPGTEDAEINQRPPALERRGQHRQVKQVGHGIAVTIHVCTGWLEAKRALPPGRKAGGRKPGVT